MNKLKEFIKKFGWLGFIKLLFYPLTVFISTPFRLMQTLWSCRILADGKWGDYNRFNPHNGLNSLFYWTRALNLYRFGRSGFSPYIGLGGYPLSRCFHYSLISLYCYWAASTVTVLLGMFGWLMMHLIWFNQITVIWLLAVMFLALISTTFYANTFISQNYNALGWLFFPLGLYGIYTGNWIIAGMAWFFASFGSFTVVLMGGILSLVVAIDSWTIAPILAVLPAALKLSIHFYPFVIQGNMKSILLKVMKAVGLVKRNVKYKSHIFVKIGIGRIYFLILYIQFLGVVYILTDKMPILFIAGLIIFLLNSTFSRFADTQSMQMLMFSLGTATALQNRNILILLSYWILISPLPLAVVHPFIKNVFDIVPRLSPFFIKRLLKDMEQFLKPVAPDERVLMAFNDPEGMRKNLFDGYCVLLELPLYVSSVKGIHFMPDWWGVFELNYEGAPHFWGRDVNTVIENIKQWNADYVVIYQNAGTELESKWRDVGFEALSRFSWADYEKDLRNMRPYAGETPEWWLLKKPQNLIK